MLSRQDSTLQPRYGQASSAGTGVELFSLMADSHKRRPELFSLTKVLRASAYNQGPAAATTIKLTSGPCHHRPGAALLVPRYGEHGQGQGDVMVMGKK